MLIKYIEKTISFREVFLTAVIFIICMLFSNLYLIFFLVTLILFSHLNIARDKLYFNKNSYIKHGINKKNNSRIGGLLILLFIFLSGYFNWQEFISNFFLNEYIYFSLIVFFVTFLGFVDDIIGGLNHIIKLYFLLFAVIFSLLNQQDLLVNNSGNEVIDLLLSNQFLSYTVTILIILGFINASNLADGANGILSGIALAFFYLVYSETQILIFEQIYLIMLIFFTYNILISRIYLGDSGSYLFGFLISTISLYYYNEGQISAGMLASLLSYPCIEIVFTILRRFNLKKNPMRPDNKHLHNILFNDFKKSIFKGKIENFANSFTGIFILSIFVLPALVYNYQIKSLISIDYWYIFILQIIIYIYLYLFFSSKESNYE